LTEDLPHINVESTLAKIHGLLQTINITWRRNRIWNPEEQKYDQLSPNQKKIEETKARSDIGQNEFPLFSTIK
jgi:hypothetical protein